MRASVNRKIKLGIFVLAGLLLFVAAIYLLGQQRHMFDSTFRISAVFQDVSGLQTGNSVRFSGINVGTIDRIELINDTSVKVDMIIDNDVKKFIRTDSKAMVGSDGLMGSKLIIISAGSPQAPHVKGNAVLASTKPLGIDDIMKNLKTTTDNANAITGDLAVIFKKLKNGEGTAGVLLSDKEFAENIKYSMADLHSTMANLKTTSSHLGGQIAHVTGDISDLTSRVRRGQGALGTVLADTAFSNNLRATMVNVREASVSFKEDMEALKHNFLLRNYFKKKNETSRNARNDDQQDSDSLEGRLVPVKSK